MRLIKKTFAIIAMTLAIPSAVYSQDLKPLSQILNERDVSDKANMIYLFVRCSAAYEYVIKLLSENGQDTTTHQHLSVRFLLMANGLKDELNKSRGVTESSDEITEKNVSNIQSLLTKYTNFSQEYWLNTGQWFKGSFIEEDLTICNSINSR